MTISKNIVDLKQKVSKNTKLSKVVRNFALIGFCLGVLFWILESAIDAFLFNRGTFINQLIAPAVSEAWMRLLVIFLLIVFGSIISGIFADITKHKVVEEAILESEKRYRAIVEDHSKVKQHFASLGCDKPVATHERRVIMPDGELRWQQWTNRVILDDSGKVIELQGTGRDISECRKAENALQESETRYRELFNNMSSGVAVYEPVENGRDFVFKNLNRAGERIDKAKKEDVVGKKVAEAFPGVEEFGLLDVFRRVYKTGKPEHYPVTLLHCIKTTYIPHGLTITFTNCLPAKSWQYMMMLLNVSRLKWI